MEFVVGATGVVTLFVVVDALSKASTEPVTVPPRATVNASPLEALDTVISAERRPASEGVAVTVTLQSTESSAFSVHDGDP